MSSPYPDRPVAGVGAVILVDGRLVLIRRGQEPLAGRWSLPGGSVELGEPLEAAVAREVLEETGLEVEVGPIVEAFDRILPDGDGRVRFHFVLVDFLCRPVGGRLAAGSDASEVTLADPSNLGGYDLTPKTAAVVGKALALAQEPSADALTTRSSRG